LAPALELELELGLEQVALRYRIWTSLWTYWAAAAVGQERVEVHRLVRRLDPLPSVEQEQERKIHSTTHSFNLA